MDARANALEGAAALRASGGLLRSSEVEQVRPLRLIAPGSPAAVADIEWS